MLKIGSANNNTSVWSLIFGLCGGSKTNIRIGFCQIGRSVGFLYCRREMMLCFLMVFGCFLDGLDDAQNVFFERFGLGLLDELIVGYIGERKPQCLLIGLRFHACCRKDNQEGGDISVYHSIFCYEALLASC